MKKRREFVRDCLLATGALMAAPLAKGAVNNNQKIKISLAEWSLHRMLQAGKLDHLDFPAKARRDFGIDTVEYVNGFFGGKKMDFKTAGKNQEYLTELLKRSKDAGVNNHLIMVDEEGFLAVPNEAERLIAVENHKKWIEAARFLSCSTVRVNLHGDGNANDKKTASIDSLSRLGEFAGTMNINVVVENHGGESSNGEWVADVMRKVNLSNVGTLPDFGNFCIAHPWGTTDDACDNEYDRYKGVEELLPFAKGVSAKTYDFDHNGEQPKINYQRLINLVKSSNFNGYIGVEFEGKTQSEEDGIRKTVQLINKYL